MALLAFGAGFVVATGPGRSERQLVTKYVKAWARNDFAQMYSLLDPASRAVIPEATFAAAYGRAAATGTLVGLIPGRVGSRSGAVIPVRMRVRTRLFGLLQTTLLVPLTGSGSGARVHWNSELLFPGLLPGEQLTRDSSMPARAALYASDGTPLAEGPDRYSPIPTVAQEIAGVLGPIPADDASAYAADGYPPNAKVGHDGLERVFQQQLAGRPEATLLAGTRILASVSAVPGQSVTTTIDPRLEQAAITAMGGMYSGIAVMDPRTGAVLALAGIAFSAPQPPGSTMKIITATAALEAGIVTLGTEFPIETSATLDGYTLQNANGEACGGTLLNAFAVSCNSVFAPLGARLGAARLVAAADRFGFDEPSSIPGAAESVIPPASSIGDALAVGSSAIGQGKVLTTPLEMADAGATIAMGGRRPIPTLLKGAKPQFVGVTTNKVAHEVQQMMIAVVNFGTGTAAAIPGVVVAGKTGTAELRNTVQPSNAPNTPPPSSPQNTDAWFVGYAPVGHAKVVVGALFPSAGAGGATAAPAVHDVLVAALG